MTDIENLRTELKKIKSYPSELEEVDCGISGVGFFPGARGLWNDNDETLSNKPVMILGHDFGAKKDYSRSVENRQENMQALTWKNLQIMLDDYNIDKADCFFTNCIMGIRIDGISAIGESPAFRNEEFLHDCKELLIKQINAQRPKLILSLGLHTIKFISTLLPNSSELSKVKSFKKLDHIGLAAIPKIEFEEIPNYTTNLVFITHPTYRHLNIGHRNLNNLRGVSFEKYLIDQFCKY